MTVLALVASIDNYINGGAATSNYGTSSAMAVQANTAEIYRILVRFDIDWGITIPNGAVISAASMTLRKYGETGNVSTGRTYFAYKLTRTDWVETEATWTIYKTGSNWSAAGGDYVTSNPAGGSAEVPAAGNYISWSDVLAIVQDAQTNGINVDILVRDNTESYAGYTGSNCYTRLNATEAYRPTLTITYTVPVASGSGTPVECVMAGII